MLNRAIAWTYSFNFEDRWGWKSHTVNAMLTVSSFPCNTKTRNEVMETSTGAQDQRS